MMKRVLIATVFSIFLSSFSRGYEVGTHAKITQEAFERSTLKSGKLTQLGLYDLNGLLGSTFNEFAPNLETRERRQYAFEQRVIQRAVFKDTLTPELLAEYQSFPYRPVGWLTVGAIREDDGTLADLLASIKVKTTYAEIYGLENVREIIDNDLPIGGHFNRFCNHFYDPTKGARPGGLDEARYSDYPSCPREGLSTGALGSQTQSGIAAPAWALALSTGTSFFDAISELQTRANHFALADAKEAMWRATTGYDGAMSCTRSELTVKDSADEYA